MAGDSFSITQTGLQGIETAMQAVSDNLSNAQTNGFQAESVDFGALLGEFVAGNALGGGTAVGGISRDFSEGAITQVNSPTDMAIQGNGFFVLQDSSGVQSFTRNGQVSENSNGTLVGFNGAELMGYPVNSAGVAGAVLAPITIPQGVLSPSASTKTTISGNLDATSPAITGAINPTDPSTYSASESVQVYDSLGNAHVLTYYFQNSGPGTSPAAENWNWTATLDGSATGLTNNSGTVGFNANGDIVSGAVPGSALTATISGAANLSLNIDFSGLTQFAGGTAATGTADGNAIGRPQGVSINSNGIVSASYSNGQNVNIAQVAVATFAAEQGLQLNSEGTYSQTSASGTPTISGANAGAAGSIVSGALENSNVDTTNQLVNLVVLQRSYQADAKALQTQDSILGTLMQIVTQ
jgi:flagellar hook protein FlgE